MASATALTNGPLEVRLATDERELKAAQKLRYRVFYEEMQAAPSDAMRRASRDFDAYDDVADHLLVLDHSRVGCDERVVGTYRLIRRDAARQVGRFYTSDEYDIAPLVAMKGEILELGSSCVDGDYRNRRVMDLLWRGIAAYIGIHDVQVMFGCASFPSAHVENHALALAYLHHNHTAPAEICPVAVPARHVDMNLMPGDAIDPRRGLASLPPLIKGYLRLGGFVGAGAVVDEQFNTVDVCVVVETARVSNRYADHYARTVGNG